jgi:hypothetical protein
MFGSGYYGNEYYAGVKRGDIFITHTLDTVTVLSTQTKTKGFLRTLSDTINKSENILVIRGKVLLDTLVASLLSRKHALTRILTSGVVLNSTILNRAGKIFKDTVGKSETIILGRAKNLSDTLVATFLTRKHSITRILLAAVVLTSSKLGRSGKYLSDTASLISTRFGIKGYNDG